MRTRGLVLALAATVIAGALPATASADGPADVSFTPNENPDYYYVVGCPYAHKVTYHGGRGGSRLTAEHELGTLEASVPN